MVSNDVISMFDFGYWLETWALKVYLKYFRLKITLVLYTIWGLKFNHLASWQARALHLCILIGSAWPAMITITSCLVFMRQKGDQMVRLLVLFRNMTCFVTTKWIFLKQKQFFIITLFGYHISFCKQHLVFEVVKYILNSTVLIDW